MSLFYDLKLKRQRAGSHSGGGGARTGPGGDVGYGGATSASDSEERDEERDYSPSSSPTRHRQYHKNRESGHHSSAGSSTASRRFSNSSSRDELTGSPSDTPTSHRSSDGDSLLSSPIGNGRSAAAAAARSRHHFLQQQQQQQDSSSHHRYPPSEMGSSHQNTFTLRHAEMIRTKSMATQAHPAGGYFGAPGAGGGVVFPPHQAVAAANLHSLLQAQAQQRANGSGGSGSSGLLPTNAMVANVNAATQFVGTILMKCLAQPRGVMETYARAAAAAQQQQSFGGAGSYGGSGEALARRSSSASVATTVESSELPVNLSMGGRQTPSESGRSGVSSHVGQRRRLLASTSSIASLSSGDLDSEVCGTGGRGGEMEEGAAGVGGGGVSSTDSPMICMICGDKATGLHYGIITCEG